MIWIYNHKIFICLCVIQCFPPNLSTMSESGNLTLTDFLTIASYCCEYTTKYYILKYGTLCDKIWLLWAGRRGHPWRLWPSAPKRSKRGPSPRRPSECFADDVPPSVPGPGAFRGTSVKSPPAQSERSDPRSPGDLGSAFAGTAHPTHLQWTCHITSNWNK